MILSVPKEIHSKERRVALTPDSVKRLVKKGFKIHVERGAGEGSNITDAEYEKAGAAMESGPEAVYSAADVVLKVKKPEMNEAVGKHEADMLKQGTALVALVYPYNNHDLVNKLAARRITTFSLDIIPRTTLAQAMDVMSSMSTLIGYKAVLTAAGLLPKIFPMLITAAGTIAPTRVLVLGAGVAGLQAVATAKRLGAIVEVFDQRAVVKEQVETLGAKFVEVKTDEETESEGGYATVLSEQYKKRQHELITKHIARSDIVITTAQIPGHRAPTLITEAMVKGMKRGSVIIDTAVEDGGNCELTEPDKEVVKHGVTISGLMSITSSLAVHASQMFSKNVENFIEHISEKDASALKIDPEDEITVGSLITRSGEVVHAKTRDFMAAAKGK